jgi:hypothetical protein
MNDQEHLWLSEDELGDRALHEPEARRRARQRRSLVGLGPRHEQPQAGSQLMTFGDTLGDRLPDVPSETGSFRLQ